MQVKNIFFRKEVLLSRFALDRTKFTLRLESTEPKCELITYLSR